MAYKGLVREAGKVQSWDVNECNSISFHLHFVGHSGWIYGDRINIMCFAFWKSLSRKHF